MAVTTVFTPYGPPATEKLGELVNLQKGGDPLAPVTVVVSNYTSSPILRRTLASSGQGTSASGGGIAAVSFINLFDLAKQFSGQSLVNKSRQPLSPLVLSAAVREVLNNDPGIFEEVAHHPSTEQALVRSYQDLGELSDEALTKLATQSNRAGEVVRIYRQTRSKLAGRWFDQQDHIDAAIEELNNDTKLSAAVVDELGAVIIHLPQRISQTQGQMVASLAAKTSVTFIVGLTGDNQADDTVLKSIRQAEVTIDDGSLPKIFKPHGHKIISASTDQEESRIAVQQVMAAARRGTPLDQIAVLHSDHGSALRQVQEQLEIAGISYNGPSCRTLADSLVGQGLLALLALENRNFRRAEVFALLSSASPVLDDGTPAPVASWERVARWAGVTQGSNQWAQRLEQYAADRRQEAKETNDHDDPEKIRAQRLERYANQADALARFMAELVDNLKPNPTPDSWKSWSKWAEGLIGTYLDNKTSQEGWPEQEQDAADAIRKILERMEGLDGIESRPRAETFRNTIAQELTASTKRIGRIGHGVFTGRIGDSLGFDLNVAILLGMAEGVFPHRPSDDPLLPDRERKATSDQLTVNADRTDGQHRNLLAALASFEHSIMVYARSDLRDCSDQHPSRWLLDTASALSGKEVSSSGLEAVEADWFDHIPSFAAGIAQADFPTTDQEFRLQALLHADRAGGHPLLKDDLVISRGFELTSARASDQFTRFDGNLLGLDLPALAGNAPSQVDNEANNEADTQVDNEANNEAPPAVAKVVSPTSLETWAECPMRYLFQHVLRVQPIKQPEDLQEISSLDKGSLVHTILEEFLKEQLANGAAPQPGDPWNKSQRDRLTEIGQEQCAEAEARGLTGVPVFWSLNRERILGDLGRFLDEDNVRRKDQHAIPVASEMAFGRPEDDLAAVSVTLDNGRRMNFQGRADRVDQGHDGSFVVTDYKIGKADNYRQLDEKTRQRRGAAWDPVQQGTRLQLPVYGLAARNQGDDADAAVMAQYWFVTSKENFASKGYSLDEPVLDRFCEVVTTIVEGIESGVFCDRPAANNLRGAYCDYCNADRLGTLHNRREWEHKKDTDQQLKSYRDLAEPLGDSNDEDG